MIAPRAARLIAACSIAALALTACATAPDLPVPPGFAGYPDGDTWRAISPDGVRLQARAFRNRPQRDAQFWQQVLQRRLAEAGYLAFDSMELSGAVHSGQVFEWRAPLGTQSWGYLTAIVVTDRRILIGEAAGPVELLDRDRQAILTTFAALGD